MGHGKHLIDSRTRLKLTNNFFQVDQQPQYSHDEYLEFERRRQEEINRLIAEGRLPPHPNMPGGYMPQDPNVRLQS